MSGRFAEGIEVPVVEIIPEQAAADTDLTETETDATLPGSENVASQSEIKHAKRKSGSTKRKKKQ